MRGLVALARCHGSPQGPYPDFPYGPSTATGVSDLATAVAQDPYAAVEKCLELLGLDRGHIGSPAWNPMAEFIRPGQQVLIKPNWVLHKNVFGGDLFGVITHSSVLRPVLDYVLRALKGRGRVIIGDAPIQSADFDLIMRQTRAPELPAELGADGVEMTICDFRRNVCRLDKSGRVVEHVDRSNEESACTVDVGTASFLEPVSGRSDGFRVTNYDPTSMRLHHRPGRHEYLIARAALKSDVVIQVPKLKTHRKAGLSCCLKSVVGINASKDYLPHHRTGPLGAGGDEYRDASFWKAMASRMTDFIEAWPAGVVAGAAGVGLRFCRKMARHFAGDPYTEGSWHGNDTIWRTVLDLNRVLSLARADGTLADSPQRRIFYVVDAILAGGGEGPLGPTPAPMGAVLAGFEPAAVDACAARLGGLDERKIALLRNGLEMARKSAADAFEPVLAQSDGRLVDLSDIEPILCLAPPADWAGHVEIDYDGMAQPAGAAQVDAPGQAAEE